MQLDISKEAEAAIQARAAAAGYASAEAYILGLVEDDAPDETSSISHEEWQKKFAAFVARQRSTNPNFDDSRESIYPVR